MPAPIFAYLRGLLQGHNITATFLQREFGYSHDAITRFLVTSSGLNLLIYQLVFNWFGLLRNGFLILDDTVIPKIYGKQFIQAQYVYSSCLNKCVFGYQIVFLVWTNGTLTIPLGWKYYQKAIDGKTKIDLAQELLYEAKHKWWVKPYAVLFDSWYSAEKILNQIHDYGWVFATQIKKNRIVNACPIQEDFPLGEDSLIGPLTGKCMVLVVKHDSKYFATNQVMMTNERLLQMYGYRWKIEEVFRFLKASLHLEECQARSFTAQQRHLESCVLAYLILEKERQEKPDKTLYQLKDDWMLDRRKGFHRINYYAVNVLMFA
jgi:putative transposase